MSTKKIKYFLSGNGNIRLTIYDLLGRTVRILVEQNQVAEDYALDWDGRDGNGNRVEAGIYFCRMEAGLPGKKIYATQKMIVLRYARSSHRT